MLGAPSGLQKSGSELSVSCDFISSGLGSQKTVPGLYLSYAPQMPDTSPGRTS